MIIPLGHLFALPKWFPTLFEKHNDTASDIPSDMFDVFVVGKSINAKDDIVYINFSTLWHLCNILRYIAAGWVMLGISVEWGWNFQSLPTFGCVSLLR